MAVKFIYFVLLSVFNLPPSCLSSFLFHLVSCLSQSGPTAQTTGLCFAEQGAVQELFSSLGLVHTTSNHTGTKQTLQNQTVLVMIKWEFPLVCIFLTALWECESCISLHSPALGGASTWSSFGMKRGHQTPSSAQWEGALPTTGEASVLRNNQVRQRFSAEILVKKEQAEEGKQNHLEFRKKK